MNTATSATAVLSGLKRFVSGQELEQHRQALIEQTGLEDEVDLRLDHERHVLGLEHHVRCSGSRLSIIPSNSCGSGSTGRSPASR